MNKTNRIETQKKSKLSARAKKFAAEMANPDTVSQTEAYQKAYPKVSKETARRNASRLLTNVDIQTEIERNKQFVLSSANVTKENSLGRLAMFAFADFDLLVNANGSIDWKKAKKAGAFKIVKKFKETVKPNGEIVREVELHDPIRALSEIADYAGWKQKPQENITDTEITAIRESLNKLAEENNTDFQTELGFFLQDSRLKPEIKNKLITEIVQ